MVSSKVNNSQNIPISESDPPLLLGCNPLPSGLFKVYIKDDIRWETSNINNFANAVINVVANAPVITPTSLQVNTDWNSNSGVSQLLNKPDLSVYYLASNPNNYISGITGAMIIDSLGFTPYNSSNPSNFISDETDPTVPSYAKTLTDFSAIKGETDVLYKPINYTPAWSEITGKLTTISGYGLTTEVNGLLSGYTPTTRTITINGTAQDLSSNRTWNVGDILSTGSYSNPSWITSLAHSKITYPGTTAQYVRGDGSIAALPNYYLASNPSGYISGISSSDVNSALGFTPYNGATNPNGYISSFTELDPLFDTKFAAKTTTDLSEGSNLYFTNARARSAILLTTTGSGVATYNNSTGVLNIPTPPSAPTINSGVARTLNSNFTISSTKQARVYYSINVTWSITALVSTASSAFLEYSLDGGSNWTTVSQVSKNVNLGLVQSGSDDLNLSGEIPINGLVRIRTTSSNATVTYVRGQEVY